MKPAVNFQGSPPVESLSREALAEREVGGGLMPGETVPW